MSDRTISNVQSKRSVTMVEQLCLTLSTLPVGLFLDAEVQR